MTDIKNQKVTGVVFLAAVISCFIGFVNNYPLVFQDTGTYIHSGFAGAVFYDRPIFYGLFIRHISLASSLWYVIFAQALLVSYLIFITLGMFFEGLKKSYVFIAIITFITLTTGYSYTVSILIPDIFTSISLLCLINLLLNKKLNKPEKAALSILFIFSITTQFSSIPVILLLLGIFALLFLLNKVRKKPQVLSAKKLGITISLFVACLFIIPSVHYLYDRQFKISGSNHVFVMNHLVETGILEDYLKTACNDHDYKFCEYKDAVGWDFIWSEESALQKTGGWEANRQEYKSIIKDIVTTPEYFVLICQKAVEYSLKQFFTFEVSLATPQLQNSSPFGQIMWRYKDSIREYISALQNQNKLNTGLVNGLQQIVILMSMVFLFVVLLTPVLYKKLSFELKWTLAIVMAHNILNSIICSNLSTVHPRFQNRIAWLLPMLAIIIIIKFIEERRARIEAGKAI